MYMSPHSDIYIYIYKKIYFRELAHAIIEAEKSQELQSANWKPRRASGITSKKKKKKKKKASRLEAQEKYNGVLCSVLSRVRLFATLWLVAC